MPILEIDDDALESFDEELMQSFAFDQHPVIKAIRQQVPAVQADGLGERTARKRALKGDDVDAQREVRRPGHARAAQIEHRRDLGQGVTKLIEQIAQIGASLWFSRIGPKQESEALAQRRRIHMQRQKAEQGLQPGR
ncbi:MAG TPA: hypothetical protein PK954_19175, partial [Anaerolineales bacterium]|nr:hypothetical protein [Anaerolineales bacterium]